ncbi:TPA: hypothetical protein MBM84_003148 [Klebsiella pneumoniae]|nr:hypothetical protein [Klebsiella pneumoniae]
MGSCAAPSAKGDDKFITTDYLQQCHDEALFHARLTTEEIGGYLMKKSGRWLNDAPDIQLVYAIPQDIYD